MKISELQKEYDKLQKLYGAKELNSIYNGGCEKNPLICFVFMNPTGKNIACVSSWKGRRSPWIGTKNIWKLFYQVGLLKEDIYQEIQKKKPNDWNEEFADEVYQEVEKKSFFITNLGKCTQIDARKISNMVYQKYLKLLYEEIKIIKPKRIVTFGNQVSSIFLEQDIKVSDCRKRCFRKKIGNDEYEVYPVYYPIGNGMRNIGKAVEDIKYILEKER